MYVKNIREVILGEGFFSDLKNAAKEGWARGVEQAKASRNQQQPVSNPQQPSTNGVVQNPDGSRSVTRGTETYTQHPDGTWTKSTKDYGYRGPSGKTHWVSGVANNTTPAPVKQQPVQPARPVQQPQPVVQPKPYASNFNSRLNQSRPQPAPQPQQQPQPKPVYKNGVRYNTDGSRSVNYGNSTYTLNNNGTYTQTTQDYGIKLPNGKVHYTGSNTQPVSDGKGNYYYKRDGQYYRFSMNGGEQVVHI